MDTREFDVAAFDQWRARERQQKRRRLLVALAALGVPLIVIVGLFLAWREVSRRAALRNSYEAGSLAQSQPALTEGQDDESAGADSSGAVAQGRTQELLTRVRQNRAPTPDLPTVLRWEALTDTTLWSLSVRFASADHPLMNSEAAARALAQSQFTGLYAEVCARDLAPYKPAIAALMSGIRFFGTSDTAYLSEDGCAPALYAIWQGKGCILLSRLASDTVYNTRRFSPKQRAAAFLQTHLLPCLPEFDRHLFDTKVAYYGIAGFYGSQEFGTDYASTDSEGVCLVVSRTDCRALVQGLLTQDQLIRQSAVFSTDRDHIGQFVRVEVVLE